MQQPELGRRLTALRKEKGLTQEDLVEKSHVSVRTIQRIEAGEVLPRMITVKILLEALGVSYESFLAEQVAMPVRKGGVTASHRITLLTAARRVPYLVAEVVLASWISPDVQHPDWGWMMNAMYIGLTVLMAVSFALFARGFVALSAIFENRLLAVAAYMPVSCRCRQGPVGCDFVVGEYGKLRFPYAIAAVLSAPSGSCMAWRCFAAGQHG
ncbi:MAG: helix-turn-helix transcriptional regulator [Cyclobacteriaceae bacterium]